MPRQYLEAILSSLPSISQGVKEITEKDGERADLIDTLIRLSVGTSSAPSHISTEEWAKARSRLDEALSHIASYSSSSGKRAREDETHGLVPGSKRFRQTEYSTESDPPIFTLHSVSVASPIRKKADITVHRTTLRLTAPSDLGENLCPPLPIRSLRHAFLVSTPGKSKPHLTTIAIPITSSDSSLIFGCDAMSPAIQYTTKYPDQKQAHPKGSSVRTLIHSLFGYFPQWEEDGPEGLVDLYEPKLNDFTSSSGTQSIDAFIGARDGHLHFFGNGILWGERKPCIWLPVDNIHDMSTRSVTGRSFSLFISMRLSATPKAEHDHEADESPEHEFSLIDAKELEPVQRWITTHKSQFASSPDVEKDVHSHAPSGPQHGVALSQAVLDESDAEDEDFALSEGDDSGSGSSRSSDDETDGGDEQEEMTNLSSASEDEIEEVDRPLNHPGAVPRMSRAAMDDAVDIVNEVFAKR